MLSQKRVRFAIDAAEEVFLWCLRALLRLKHCEMERQELLEFQPRLAGAIFELDRLRHEASKEKRSLSARERSLNPEWLAHRLAILDQYKRKLDLAFPLRSPERFKRQMQRMVDVATVSPPTEKRRLRLGVDYSSLAGVFEEATSSGLALPKRIWEQLRELPPKLYPLCTESLEDNALWIGSLVLKYLPGITPILWSAMPNELLQGIFEERVVVVTLYNPARFIQRLRAFGFEVSIVKEEATLSIVYSGADRRAEVHNSMYFLSLIQHFLVDESSVAEAIHDLVRDGVSGRYGKKAEIIWKPMQFRPEVEDLENRLGPPRSPRSS
jgi:hypothetical protein